MEDRENFAFVLAGKRNSCSLNVSSSIYFT